MRLNSEENYIEHAKKLFEEGKLQLSLHILDIIIKGTDEMHNKILLEAFNLKYKILKQKANDETSFIAANIIDNATYQIKEKIKDLKLN